MKTRLTSDPAEAAAFIREGGIVAFPTETVYGLGAAVSDAGAVENIFRAKRRPADNPLIAHIFDKVQVRDLAREIPPNAAKFIEAFWPGPLTVVLTKSDGVPLVASAGLATIGVRMPANELARLFLTACETAVVAPSANLSGRPSPTTWEAVIEDLDGRIDCLLRGGPTDIGLESTVVDCTSDVPLVLRAGAVSLEQLRAIVPETRIHDSTNDETPRSPGVKHKHYSPSASVVLLPPGDSVTARKGMAYIGLTTPDDGFTFTMILDSVEEYARKFFEFLRECDRRNIESVYCETVEETGLGAGLMDRLRRAAGV